MKDITPSKAHFVVLLVAIFMLLGVMIMASVMLEQERKKVAELEEQVVELEAQTFDKAPIVHKAFYNDTCALLDMYDFDVWHIDRYSDGTYDFSATRDNISFRSYDLEGISDIRESAKSAYQALQALNR